MRQRVYFLAFLKFDYQEYPQYQWYMDLVDINGIEEFLTKIQIEHLKNRLVGAWRHSIPFNITFKLMEIHHLDYSI